MAATDCQSIWGDLALGSSAAWETRRGGGTPKAPDEPVRTLARDPVADNLKGLSSATPTAATAEKVRIARELRPEAARVYEGVGGPVVGPGFVRPLDPLNRPPDEPERRVTYEPVPDALLAKKISEYASRFPEVGDATTPSEFFNLLNRTQFGPPNTTCCSANNPNFGAVTSTAAGTNPRLVQFALKLFF